MTKFRIAYEISGSVIVDAASAEEAQTNFNRDYGLRELAELGLLEVFEPETEHQRQMRRIYLADVMDAALKDGPHG